MLALSYPTYLRWRISVWKQQPQYRSPAHQIFHLESILIGIVRGLVVVEHEVDDVGLRRDEDDLKDGVPDVFGRVRPEQIEVSGHVDGQVEELRFEGDAGRALYMSGSAAVATTLSGMDMRTLDDRILARSMNIEATWERSAVVSLAFQCLDPRSQCDRYLLSGRDSSCWRCVGPDEGRWGVRIEVLWSFASVAMFATEPSRISQQRPVVTKNVLQEPLLPYATGLPEV